MIGFIVALLPRGLVAWIRANRAAAGLLALVFLVFVAMVAWQVATAIGAHRERGRIKARDAQAVAAAVTRNSGALEAAAAQRRLDDASSAATERDLNDAVKTLPDAVPSARRIALGCARLRRSGQDTSALPECR